MWEQAAQVAWTGAAAVLTALAGLIWRAVQAYTVNLVQQRLGAGAARVAGQIVAEISARPDVQAASQAMIEVGVQIMRANFPDSSRKISDDRLAGMITGELGRLGQAVIR